MNTQRIKNLIETAPTFEKARDNPWLYATLLQQLKLALAEEPAPAVVEKPVEKTVVETLKPRKRRLEED